MNKKTNKLKQTKTFKLFTKKELDNSIKRDVIIYGLNAYINIGQCIHWVDGGSLY